MNELVNAMERAGIEFDSDSLWTYRPIYPVCNQRTPEQALLIAKYEAELARNPEGVQCIIDHIFLDREIMEMSRPEFMNPSDG